MQATLDERVDALERQVRELTEIVAGKPPARDWRSTFGIFRDDEGYDEMVRLGAEIRQKDRELPAPMLILDTDHLSEFERGLAAGARLAQRLNASGEEAAITIVSVEEQLRGWLAQIARLQDPYRETAPYRRLQERVVSFAAWKVLPWTQETAEIFVRLRAGGVRIGAMDLKIASVALSRNAMVLTRNLRHFEKVPGLRAEDWL